MTEIQEVTFAQRWILENKANRPTLNSRRRIEAEHQIEVVGAELRKMMSWMK